MSNEESITLDGYEYYVAAFPDAFAMLNENQGCLLARALKLGAADGWEPDDAKACRLARYILIEDNSPHGVVDFRTLRGVDQYVAAFPAQLGPLTKEQQHRVVEGLALGIHEGWEPSVVTVQEFVDQVVENKPRRRVEDVHASVKAQSFLTRARKQCDPQ